jgi:hypothetical protein
VVCLWLTDGEKALKEKGKGRLLMMPRSVTPVRYIDIVLQLTKAMKAENDRLPVGESKRVCQHQNHGFASYTIG